MTKGLKLVVAEKPVKLMTGTDGKKSYFAFARNGDVALGVKPEGVLPGIRYGVPDTVYFCARVRSAASHGLFAEEDATKKVVKLHKEPDNFWDAWPGVTWEQKSQSRASTTIGVFIKGDFSKDPDKMKLLLAAIGDGKLARQMATYLFGLAGADRTICPVEELAAWIDSQYAAQVQKIVDFVEKQKQVQEAFAATVGNFGMQAALLNQVYEAKKAAKPDEAELADSEEGEGDED